MIKKSEKTQIHEFEREHYPCAKEWWCTEGFFTTIENNNKWSFRSILSQGICRDKSIWKTYSVSIFDLDNHKTYSYNSLEDSMKLDSAKDIFNIKYDKSYIKGSYPNYQTYFLDLNNNINLDLKYNAKSLPYWVAQQITNGWMPWSFGYLRYGFIPKNEIKGSIIINNQKFAVNGKGYFEHIWGDFSFFNLYSSKRSFKKIISTYAKLLGNWLNNQNIKIPKSIMFSTNNRPPGYDWIWAILDNGWSIFFGNMMLWIMEGLGTGILILSKDGKKYSEFSNIRFKYNKMKYLEKYDFYYPTELQIFAKKGHEKLYLHISSISESSEDVNEATDQKSLFGFLITEVPSKINGYYYNGDKKTIIKGLSKLESHRLLRIFGYNSLKINFELSKNRFGFLSSFDSHYLRKKFDINLQFLPRPNLKIIFNKTDKSQFKK